MIADNATGKFGPARGAVRRGEALLAGLLRCGHCGRKLHVAYSGKGGNTGRYHCRGSQINHGGARCISFGGMRVDRAVSTEIITRLQPLGIEAALQADAVRGQAHAEKRHQLELSLELNRPGFAGEFFVQNLGDVIKSIYARVEGFLHFLRRPIANSSM